MREFRLLISNCWRNVGGCIGYLLLTLENKKTFELKNWGYRDGIKRKRQDRDGV